MHAADWLAPRVFRQRERPRCACDDAGHRGSRLRCRDEFLRLRRLWLHGGLNRFFQQPAVGYWNSGGDWRRVAARGRRKTVRVAGFGQSVDGIRAFHYRRDLQRRSNREQ